MSGTLIVLLSYLWLCQANDAPSQVTGTGTLDPPSTECASSICSDVSSLREAVINLTTVVNGLQNKLSSKNGRNVYPLTYVDGARWRAFWWYKPRTPWPGNVVDVLKDEYGACDAGAPICFGRLPPGLKEDISEMLGEDTSGTIYRWKFSSKNTLAHAVWGALHDHMTMKLVNSANWMPKVVKGPGPAANQDSFQYRLQHGVKSLMIDDDGCDCLTSLSMGHGMCGTTFSTKYGTENSYGVDLLHDPSCASPNNTNGLTLYFRDDDDCSNVTCSTGKTCHDGVYSYTCE